MSTDDTLSWINNKGLPNPEPVNIKGERGQNGIDGVNGQDGAAATIQIGRVTTLNPDQQATVTNTGTASAAVFDFAIPKGEKGERGLQGEKGDTGEQGERGETGYYFTPNVSTDGELSWSNNGGLDNPTPINIKGEKGETGQNGYTPVKGTDYWTSEDIVTMTNVIKETMDETFLSKADAQTTYVTIKELDNIRISYFESYSDKNGYIKNTVEETEDYTILILNIMYFHPNLKIWCPCVSYQNISNDEYIITGGIKADAVVLGGAITAQVFPNCLYRIFYQKILK